MPQALLFLLTKASLGHSYFEFPFLDIVEIMIIRNAITCNAARVMIHANVMN